MTYNVVHERSNSGSLNNASINKQMCASLPPIVTMRVDKSMFHIKQLKLSDVFSISKGDISWLDTSAFMLSSIS